MQTMYNYKRFTTSHCIHCNTTQNLQWLLQ